MKVALYKGKRGGFAGAFDAAVRWWTRGAYSHVELIFSDGMSASASARDGGVRFKDIEYHPDRWDIIEIEADEEYARAFIEKRVGLGYDYFGLFGFVWRPHNGAASLWFCSELIAGALKLNDPWRYCVNTISSIFRSFARGVYSIGSIRPRK
jgi:hypothetical protein